MLKRGFVAGAILGAYVIGRLIVLSGGEVFTSHDSAVYAPRTDPSLNHGPLVSFTGHAPRVWGVPLFYSLFSDDQGRAVAQWLLGTAAWAVLALAVASHLRTLAGRATALACVLLLGLLDVVASWDFAILSESLSLTLGALVVGLFLIWRRFSSTIFLVASVVVAVWWTFVRPDIVLFTGVTMICLVTMAVRRNGTEDRRRQIQAAAGAVVLLGAIGWYAAITPTINRQFKPYSGTSLKVNPLPADEEAFVYRLRVDVFTDPALMKVFHTKLGMPACPGTDAFVYRAEWDFLDFSQEYQRCPELKNWGARNKHRFWTMLFQAAPDQFGRKLLGDMSQVFGGEPYAKVGRPIPPALERMVFPSWRYGLAVALVGLGLTLALTFKTRAWRVHPTLLRVGLVLSATAMISALVAVIAASGEYRRFGLQETVAVRLSMVIFICAAVDAVVMRRHPEPAPAGETSASAT